MFRQFVVVGCLSLWMLVCNSTGAEPQRRDSAAAQQGTHHAAQGSSDSARRVSVLIMPTGFMPNVLRLDGSPGDKVRVDVTNRDKSLHGLRINLGDKEVGLDQPLAPGKSAKFEFTIPPSGGMGSFYSPVGDDRSKGFQGRAIVGGEAPGGMM